MLTPFTMCPPVCSVGGSQALWPGLQAGIPLGCRRCAYPGAGCVWLSGRVSRWTHMPGVLGDVYPCRCIYPGAVLDCRSETGLVCLVVCKHRAYPVGCVWARACVYPGWDAYGMGVPMRVCIPVGMHMAWGCLCACVSQVDAYGMGRARSFVLWALAVRIRRDAYGSACSCVSSGCICSRVPLGRVYLRDAYACGSSSGCS